MMPRRMKKLFHGVTGCVRFLILLALGLSLLTFTLGGTRFGEQDCWLWVLDALRPFRVHAMAAGGGILILELLHLLARPRPGRCPDELTFKSKGGEITVKTEAIRVAIARVADEFDCVESMDTTVTRSHGGVDLDLTVRVIAETPIPVLCNDLQNRAREVVAQQIGLFELRQVRVHVLDLLRKGKVTAPAEPQTRIQQALRDEEAPTRGTDDA